MTTTDHTLATEFRNWLAARPKPANTSTLSTWFSSRHINLLTERLDIAIDAGVSEDIRQLIRRAFE